MEFKTLHQKYSPYNKIYFLSHLQSVRLLTKNTALVSFPPWTWEFVPVMNCGFFLIILILKVLLGNRFNRLITFKAIHWILVGSSLLEGTGFYFLCTSVKSSIDVFRFSVLTSMSTFFSNCHSSLAVGFRSCQNQPLNSAEKAISHFAIVCHLMINTTPLSSKLVVMEVSKDGKGAATCWQRDGWNSLIASDDSNLYSCWCTISAVVSSWRMFLLHWADRFNFSWTSSIFWYVSLIRGEAGKSRTEVKKGFIIC